MRLPQLRQLSPGQVALGLAFVFAALLLFLRQGPEMFDPRTEPVRLLGWLAAYNAFKWITIPAWLEDAGSPPAGQTAYTFDPATQPVLVAIESVSGNPLKRISVEGTSNPATFKLVDENAAKNMAQTTDELWALINTNGRYQIRSARPTDLWIATDVANAAGPCSKITTIGTQWSSWIIEAANVAGVSNTFFIRTPVCQDGERYYVGIVNNALAMVPGKSVSTTSPNGLHVWVFKRVLQGTPGATLAPGTTSAPGTTQAPGTSAPGTTQAPGTVQLKFFSPTVVYKLSAGYPDMAARIGTTRWFYGHHTNAAGVYGNFRIGLEADDPSRPAVRSMTMHKLVDKVWVPVTTVADMAPLVPNANLPDALAFDLKEWDGPPERSGAAPAPTSAPLTAAPVPASLTPVLDFDASKETFVAGSAVPTWVNRGSMGTMYNAAGFGAPKMGEAQSYKHIEFRRASENYFQVPQLPMNWFQQGGAYRGVTVVVVARFVDAPTVRNWERLIDFGIGANNNNLILCRYGAWDELHGDIRNGGETFEANMQFPPFDSSFRAFILNVTNSASGGTVTVYHNDLTQKASTAFKDPIANRTTTTNFIGKSNWGDPLLNADVRQVTMYDRSLSDAEMGTVLANLKQKWGMHLGSRVGGPTQAPTQAPSTVQLKFYSPGNVYKASAGYAGLLARIGTKKWFYGHYTNAAGVYGNFRIGFNDPQNGVIHQVAVEKLVDKAWAPVTGDAMFLPLVAKGEPGNPDLAPALDMKEWVPADPAQVNR